MLNEKIKKYPEWLEQDHTYDARIRTFYQKEAKYPYYLEGIDDYNSKQLSRLCHIEMFEHGIIDEEAVEGAMVIYNYIKRNVLNHDAKTVVMSLNSFLDYTEIIEHI
jgi:hypothetical protein